jgi:NYN domain-containing protein/OST-HTH/LOTUS domain-containing protein
MARIDGEERGMGERNNNKHDGESTQRRLAVLIDADNAPASMIEGLLSEVAKYGVASVKRIYGDFTSTRASQWKEKLLEHSINPVQQFAYTSGKNATDSSLIIDAMDLMYTGRFDGMCLVSSDSDFTRLAQRLREEGLIVYGFGERKTPGAFVQACDKFIYTEVLRADAAPVETKPRAPRDGNKKKAADAAAGAPTSGARKAAEAPAKAGVLPMPMALLRRAIEDASDEQGWAHLGAVGSYLTKIRPDFDPRLYGQRKLSDLFKHDTRHFAIEERAGAGGSKTVYVRALD